jgi:hypothetical protein
VVTHAISRAVLSSIAIALGQRKISLDKTFHYINTELVTISTLSY